jgi:MFS transporter, ACS family, hexuronate transporter
VRLVRLERLRWLILGLLFLSTVINYVDRQALSVLLPTLRGELGLSSAEYGTITTLFLAAYTVAQLGAGVVIDRVGTQRGFAWAIVVWSIAAVAHAFARGPVSLSVFRFALGIGEAGNWPAGGKAVAQWFPQQRRAFAMAVFDGGSAVGAIIAPPLVAALALHFGWRSAFVFTGLVGFAWLALWLWAYGSPESHKWLSKEDREIAAKEGGAAGSQSRSFGASLRDIIGMRQLWGLMVTRMVATPVWWFYVFWLPDYLGKGRGFSLKEIGMFGWIPYLTVDIGKMAGGAASDRLLGRGFSATFARKSVMVAGALAMTGGVQVVGADSPAAAIVWVSVATFGFGMWSANILALHADIFPSEAMASAIGLTGMAASLGGAAFTYAVGQVVDRAGYAPVFWAAGVAALVACLALFFWVGRVEKAGVRQEVAA